MIDCRCLKSGIGALLVILSGTLAGAGEEFRSHSPVRPLPSASERPLGKGPARFVDAMRGDDTNDGSESAPWKTLDHAVDKLQPGDTLYLRDGIYYEAARFSISGTEEQPITIRAYPGELAIVDAGFREFFESPAEAWEPAPGGADGEYQSKKVYPRGGGFGNFGDSMVPFQRYLTFHDLRSTNELWHAGLSNRADDPVGLYAGPGVRRDVTTGRIHIRLAHTKLSGLGERHYRGETDPRKLPLVIVGNDVAIEIDGAKHLRLQDLVVRGAERSAVSVRDSTQIEFDNCTLYGSSSAFRTHGTTGLRLIGCRLRGHAAPWHSRGHHKDRAGAGYLVVAEGRDFEFARCEFTDHHDGLHIHGVDGMRIHHSFIEHFNDDGIELGPKKPQGKTLIYQNYIAQCLTTFTLHGSAQPVDSEPGAGNYIYRNVVDLRKPLYKGTPSAPDPTGAFLRREGRVAGDHGGPTWPICYLYHNTFVIPTQNWRGYYAFGWGSHMRATTRRVMNNIFVQIDDLPGLSLAGMSPEDDFAAAGNLFWSVNAGPSYDGDIFAVRRQSTAFQESKSKHPPGWGAEDIFADPQFVQSGPDPSSRLDVRLHPGSPAIDAGTELPQSWPDSLRSDDRGRPDIGALPSGAEPLSVGPEASD